MKHIKLFESQNEYWSQLLLRELKRFGNIYDAYFSSEEDLPANKAKMIYLFCAWVQKQGIKLSQSNIESRYKEFMSLYTDSPNKFVNLELVDSEEKEKKSDTDFFKEGKSIYVMDIGSVMIPSKILSYDDKTQTLTLKVNKDGIF